MKQTIRTPYFEIGTKNYIYGDKVLEYALAADKAAEITGYTKTTVISHIRDKHISAVLISGKYIVPKSALVDFIVSDIAFEIVNKSPWHMNTILLFVEKE